MCASLTKTKSPNRRGKINEIARKIGIWVEERKRVKLGEIAIRLGYNYGYLRYKILPAILETEECMKLVKVNGVTYLEWTCPDSEDSEVGQ